MWFWPNVQLTDYEKKFVRIYKDDEYPGVLRRVYNLQWANIAQPENNIPTVKTIDKYQVARRSRIFGIMFSGNIDQWRLKLSNTNGTQYTNPAPRSQQYPVISSIIAGSHFNALSRGGFPAGTPIPYPSESSSLGPNPDFSNQFMSNMQSFPWLIEPNWVCQPNETLIFEGTFIGPTWLVEGETPEEYIPRTVVNIAVYAWEFPGMYV